MLYCSVILHFFIFLICKNVVFAQSTNDERYNRNDIHNNINCQCDFIQDIVTQQENVHKSDFAAQKLLIEELKQNLTEKIHGIQSNEQCDQMRDMIAYQEHVFKNESAAQKLLIEKLAKDLNETVDVTNKYIDIILKQNDVIEGLKTMIREQAAEIKEIKDVVNAKYAKDCASYFKLGHLTSGVYTLFIPLLNKTVEVYCDMITNGGGWTVFQHREKGDVNFTQPWASYKAGFGNITGDHWLGNDILAAMTADRAVGYKLRVELMKFSLDTGYAEYTNFKVGNERDYYRLTVGAYNGTAGDNGNGLLDNNNLRFTTIDNDNDDHSENCAHPDGYYGGGWWYTSNCGHTNLNGPYTNVRKRSYGDDIFWQPFDGYYSLKQTEMKFRPMNF